MRSITILCFILTFLTACDSEYLSESFVETNQLPEQREQFDRLGSNIAFAISEKINHPKFKFAVLTEVNKMEDGDYEVLLKDLFSRHPVTHELLTGQGQNMLNAYDLDLFLEQHPSMILGVRGSTESWLNGQYAPPVAFVSSTFKEEDTSIAGARQGKAFKVPLDKYFEQAVIALRISERHDLSGELITTQYDSHPNFDKDGIEVFGGPGALAAICPIPLDCPSVPYTISNFNLDNWNGGFRLSYEINNLNLNHACWFEILISRLNPDGTVTLFERSGEDPTEFFDFDVNPNLTYVYFLEASLIFPDTSFPGRKVSCNRVIASVSATSEESGPQISTFRGNSFSNTTINYSWSTPEDVVIYEYKLSYWNGSDFIEEAILNGGSTEYNFTFPQQDRGKKVRMMIQYRPGGGDFTGNFQDITYAPYRTDGMPLYFLGIHMTQPELYELSDVGESPINGYPEFNITAYQGAYPDETEIIVENLKRRATLCPFTNFFMPSDPVIITNWPRGLTTSAIKIHLHETDALDPVTGEVSNQEEVSTSVSAEVGFKRLDTLQGAGSSNTGQIGVRSSWKSGRSIRFNYPISDIPLGVSTIYYHEELLVQRGNTLFSTNNDNVCFTAGQFYGN